MNGSSGALPEATLVALSSCPQTLLLIFLCLYRICHSFVFLPSFQKPFENVCLILLRFEERRKELEYF